MRVLFVTIVLPSRRRTGGEIASQSYIEAIRAAGHEVKVLGYIRSGDDYAPGENEAPVDFIPIETSRAGTGRVLRWIVSSLIRREPYICSKFRTPTYPRKLRQYLDDGNYAAVVLDHCRLAWLLDSIPPEMPLVSIAHNLEHEMYGLLRDITDSKVKKWLYGRENRLVEEVEKRLCRRANQVWALTEHDGEWFGKYGNTAVFQLPANTQKNSPAQPEEIPVVAEIGLLGNWTWPPNREGLEWFLNQVYPLLPDKMRIRVAGRGYLPPPGAFPGVEFPGFVDDAQAFLKGNRLIAIPSVSGGGVQIKTLEAIASGMQVVATPTALRGIENFPATVTVASEPEEFAAALASALNTDTGKQAKAIATAWAEERKQRFHRDIARQMDLLPAGKPA